MSRKPEVSIAALDEDYAIHIKDALLKAIFSPGDNPLPADILQERSLARYHESWGREGDFGFAAVLEASGAVVGVCWCRLLSGDNKGYGHVNDATPELSIAVWESFRDRGIGAMLLDRIIGEARSRGYEGLSLSVQSGNRSVSLYERKGFKTVGNVDDAYTMYLDLS
ncbi:MAG: GNAT family N-acetyltransferase [Actinobacteria bacterium]|nr:GNAT family N-acetyltransferase [Actinomycetota bacterium]